jgi:hypothetical protein
VTNPQKRKGNAWELAVRRFLRAQGIDAFKPYEEGHEDAGDVHGTDPFILQAKNYTSWQDAIREGLDGAERQKRVAGAHWGAAVVKRLRRPVEAAYVVMTLATFAEVLNALRDTGCDSCPYCTRTPSHLLPPE